tara:strand:- start:6547 stop:6699 length:153 start_codon:yes stop_codon:yes gene_type:complete
MEVIITPDHITMDTPFTQSELQYLMDLMMGDYHTSNNRLYKKLKEMKDGR